MMQVLRAAVEAAVWAPSVHNTQPWSFCVSGAEVRLSADPERRLRVTDPDGRQMLISCGAALFNLRIALRALGHRPVVRLLPDPDSPLLLATVRAGEPAPPDELAGLLYGEIERRRTHRSGFTALPIADELVDELVAAAGNEGARLIPVRADPMLRVLAALTGAAQEIQATDRRYALEMARWARPPGSARRDGVPADSYPTARRRGVPYHFAERDYGRGEGWGGGDEEPICAGTGLVVLLTTEGDTREDWLVAGQALQRVLLQASAYGVSAAFHGQALEMPDLRAFIRRHVCGGAHPQLLMRLGFALDEASSVRRPVAEVLREP